MKDRRDARILPRGRIAKWSKEQIDTLSTLELRALLDNAQRLKEPEVAALCNELLDARPRGRAPVRRERQPGVPLRLVARGKAFEMHGVRVRHRVWSRGGLRSDGAVVLTVVAAEVQKGEGLDSYLLWAPNIGDSQPWSDTPGGKERLEHCRIALERGAAEGLLIYGKRAAGAPPKDNGTSSGRVDAETVLSLRVEKRGEEYWATCAPQKQVVSTFE
ncbi:MAG: hypothetical protein ACREUS_13605 [Burkholderiales bacterium]